MGKTGLLLALLAAPAVLACVALLFWEDGKISAVQTPDLGPPTVANAPSVTGDPSGGGDADEVPEGRIGRFERVENVPGYEVLEQGRNERDGARGALLLIDTRSRGQRDFTLITRDVKARYDGLDAVTLRFIDSETVLDYNGSAVIFNTPTGAYYAGYVWGPPNAEGYLVDAAE